MERRVLLAVFLCFVVLYAYQALFVKTPAPRPRQASQQAERNAPKPPAAAPSAPVPAMPEGQNVPPAPQAGAVPAPVVADREERTVTIETAVVRAVFTNRGGRLLSWRLKQYLDERRQPLELVSDVPAGAPRPFTRRLDDPDVTARVNDALFLPSDTASRIDGTKQAVNLAFEYQDASGLRVRKSFSFDPGSYVIGVDLSVQRADQPLNPLVVWGPGLGDAASTGESSRYLQKPEAIFFQDGRIVRMSAQQLSTSPVHDGAIRFAGVDDHYFVAAALPKGNMRVEYQPLTIPVAGQSNQTTSLVDFAVRTARATPGLRVFAGPKDFDVLKSTDPEMVRVINFGIFAWLAVPLLRALKSINAYVGNYGWAIIILTILINVAMFPLRHKSMVSMRKMQQMQPEIKAIQDRYAKLKATDPAKQKMNVEMMNLYREKGVSPVSGCLPMVLTMPVLFAFYSMLSQAIEVRGAPFGLWIHDLSRHDPYYVMPILMGLTMVWQQRMTPSSVDPAQQKMMMIMPIFFTAFFLWAPSGLALYFLLSNLLAIGQQYLTNNVLSPAPARASKPPRASDRKAATK